MMTFLTTKAKELSAELEMIRKRKADLEMLEDKFNSELAYEIAQSSKDAEIIKPAAVVLHGAFCTHNHTDGCGWFYGVKNNEHDWSESSHQHYFGIARQLLLKNPEFADVDKLKGFIDAVKLIRGY